jgi:PelA/Pel-15E family pectate lyase
MRDPRWTIPLLVIAGWAGLLAAVERPSGAKPGQAAAKAIDTSGFRSSAHHWRNIRDSSRFIPALPDQPVYAPTQVRGIVANILLFQRENGGWPKDYDMLAVLTENQKAAVEATRKRSDASFDNGNLHSQVDYLARAYAVYGETEWREACLRGFDFMLHAQYSNGGFPQRYPKPKDYHAHITLNDGVMIGILNVLKDAADGQPHFAWLDAERRDRAREAVQRGVECLLKCQIRGDGQPTGWCQQHDETTFEARPARAFELASICPQDTTEVVRFLMRWEQPSPEVVRAVEAAVNWMREVKLTGLRLEKVNAPREEFLRHTADFDVVLRPDAQAKPLWARHYEIGTNRPIFAGRDGVKKYALAEIERERRTGTPWYGTWPQKLLDKDFSKWHENISHAAR